MKRIASLDVLGQARRARNILNRIIAYLEQQEKAARRLQKKRLERAEIAEMAARARTPIEPGAL